MLMVHPKAGSTSARVSVHAATLSLKQAKTLILVVLRIKWKRQDERMETAVKREDEMLRVHLVASLGTSLSWFGFLHQP